MEIVAIIIVVWILFKLFGSSSSGASPKSSATDPSNKPNPSQNLSTPNQATPKPKAASRPTASVPARASSRTKSKPTYSPSIRRKPNWQEFQRIVAHHNIRELYHFTDRRNLNSIRRHGALCSWSYCDTHGIRIPFPASNELSKSLDLKKGLQDFVRLSFNRKQPMMYIVQSRGVTPFVLEISPEVIYWFDTQFSDVNATASYVTVGPTLDDFKRINFPLALTGNWKTPQEKAIIQAEVLVKTKIPIQFIRNL